MNKTMKKMVQDTANRHRKITLLTDTNTSTGEMHLTAHDQRWNEDMHTDPMFSISTATDSLMGIMDYAEDEISEIIDAYREVGYGVASAGEWNAYDEGRSFRSVVLMGSSADVSIPRGVKVVPEQIAAHIKSDYPIVFTHVNERTNTVCLSVTSTGEMSDKNAATLLGAYRSTEQFLHTRAGL